MNRQKTVRKNRTELVHPYSQKIDAKLEKLKGLVNGIMDLADNNLMLADRDTGINNFDLQHKFADKLEEVGKHLTQLTKDCSLKAAQIREKIEFYQDSKLQFQDSYFVGEVVKTSEKDPTAKKHPPKDFIRDETVILKREHYATWISDDESDDDDDGTPQAGDMDTKFTYRKKNNNEELNHICVCEVCEQIFRDNQELCNHESTHHKELYRCMACNTVCRSVRAYYNHRKTDHQVTYHCPFPDCNNSYSLKTSLMNHEQKHSSYQYTCQLAKCQKKFQYRQTYLEHINYRHRDSKSVPCPICKKMYWTPSAMRSHRAKIHGLVTEMYRGAL